MCPGFAQSEGVAQAEKQLAHRINPPQQELLQCPNVFNHQAPVAHHRAGTRNYTRHFKASRQPQVAVET
ncbi:hypothetical protein, partial [Stenotrophomonas maltophilia]|uniref:hypothetical protein n=1 Tax=Stenotrophomonas maltophilia TaxID=40324 RepID=UPI003CCFE597